MQLPKRITFKSDTKARLFRFLLAASLLNLSQIASAEDGVPLHGFADAGWASGSPSQVAREKTDGFVLGTVDLYLNPQFQDNVKSLIEIALEPDLDSQEYDLDVERIQVGYVYGEWGTLWAGRFHTPYGYWNTAFHHGAQLQPSIYKPRFIDWEDHAGFMPSHSTGIWFQGKLGVGSGKFAYDLWMSNGNRNIAGESDMNILRDDNHTPGYGGRAAYNFGGALDGLSIGVHALTDEIDLYAADLTTQLSRGKMNMYGGFAVYESDLIEFSAEYYWFANPNQNNGGSPIYHSSAGFVHLGYNATANNQVYVRFEDANIDNEDPYFNNLENGFSYIRSVVGMRHNINARACVKVEANRTSIEDSITNPSNLGTQGIGLAPVNPGTFDELRVQYAISF